MNHILLSGGAGLHDTKHLIYLFLSLISTDAKVLVIRISDKDFNNRFTSRYRRLMDFFNPHYWNTRTLANIMRNPITFLSDKLQSIINPVYAQYQKMVPTYNDIGIKNFTLWTDLRDKNVADLKKYSAIQIAGGNTFEILHHLKETGFDKGIKQFIQNGGIFYGVCSGANVLGKNIAIASIYDNNTVLLRDTFGLYLVDNYSVCSDYKSEYDESIIAFVKKYRSPVIGLSKKSCAYVTHNTLTVIGEGKVYAFNPTKKLIRQIRFAHN